MSNDITISSQSAEEKTEREAEIKNELAHFTGTECYHAYGRIVLTDGALRMAELCKAFWLMDVVASWQTAKRVVCEHFQTWEITARDSKAEVKATDGNDKTIALQKIEYTDFPMRHAKLYLVNDGRYRVLMLPSEY